MAKHSQLRYGLGLVNSRYNFESTISWFDKGRLLLIIEILSK